MRGAAGFRCAIALLLRAHVRDGNPRPPLPASGGARHETPFSFAWDSSPDPLCLPLAKGSASAMVACRPPAPSACAHRRSPDAERDVPAIGKPCFSRQCLQPLGFGAEAIVNGPPHPLRPLRERISRAAVAGEIAPDLGGTGKRASPRLLPLASVRQPQAALARKPPSASIVQLACAMLTRRALPEATDAAEMRNVEREPDRLPA